jgi:hypothetical protein
MNTVGIFAGRGDVILAMGISFLVGIWAGYYLHKIVMFFVKFKKG